MIITIDKHTTSLSRVFFLIWTGIDCLLTLVTFIPNCFKFIISIIGVCCEKNWQPFTTCCCNICSCFCISCSLYIIFANVGLYFGLGPLLGVLLPVSLLLISSCILTCVSFILFRKRTSKVDVSGGEEENFSRNVSSYWPEILNFICDVFNYIVILAMCIYFALYSAQVGKTTTTSTTKKTT
jgi:hypothetical protein